MKTQVNLIQTGPLGGALAALCLVFIAQAKAAPLLPQGAPPKPFAPIPWSELGARAGADYRGDGLSVKSGANGARLRCVFQRLEGEATTEGLWLISTVTNAAQERFRVVASLVGRNSSTVGEQLASGVLPRTGMVEVANKLVRFVRPGLTEEYSVSMDGMRQDFVVMKRPEGTGRLRVELEVTGAKVQPLGNGAQLVLDGSGRKIAYSRLRVTDATGKELAARMEVPSIRDEVTPCLKSDAGRAGSPLPAADSAHGVSRHTVPMLAVVVDDTGAAYPVRIDPTFSDANWISLGNIPGADSAIYAAVADGSGNLYIGGHFTSVGGVSVNRIAKWNGSSWSALGSGVNSNVLALAVSGSDVYAGGAFTTAINGDGIAVTVNYIAKWDGTRNSWSALGLGMGGSSIAWVRALAVSGSDVYAGGYFTTASDSDGAAVTANHIAKWDGTRNSWSALGLGMNYVVFALAVSASGVYAGGAFTMADDTAANHIAKWDGTSWRAMDSGTDNEVDALAVSGSYVYAGGFFKTAGGIPARNVAKWNGNSWLALGSGVSYIVNALAVSGGAVYAGGAFTRATNADGTVVTANYIAKWNGSSWTAVGAGVGGGPAPTVYALAVSGGDLYAGGSFTTATNGDGVTVTVNYIAKWKDSSWAGLGQGMNDGVRALAVCGGDLYVGGWFTMAGGREANYIAKWNGDGWSALGSGLNGEVYALAVSGGDLYAGGAFTRVTNSGGLTVSADHIAKWNGREWFALGSGGLDGTVLALAVSGSDLYAGGSFTMAINYAPPMAIPVSYIAKWNGGYWSALGSGMNNYVSALAVSGSDLYAGGAFTTATNSGDVPIAVNHIAKWDGSGWSALVSGVNGAVYSLAVSGSEMYAGGNFTTASGTAASFIAKWNGRTWDPVGLGVNGPVLALAVLASDLYVGGFFTTATDSGGVAVTVNNIAKWSGNWSALGSGVMNGYVLALAVTGSDVYAGGGFTTADGSPANRIAKWNGGGWTAVGSGLNDAVVALAVSGEEVYAGGDFTTAGGSAANYVAKWNGSSWSALGSGMNDVVYALAASGSNVYAGGTFTRAINSDGGIVAANYVAKWDGSRWSALGLGIGGDYGLYSPAVLALAVSGRDLYVGGGFTRATNITQKVVKANYIAKWDGASWWNLSSGMDDIVFALAVSGGDLYAGGSFFSAGGKPATHIAKWNGTWSAVGWVNSQVNALAVSGSDLYAGGFFTYADNAAANGIAKWNGNGWTALGSGVNPLGVWALAVSGGDLYAGGVFTSAGGKLSGYAARAIVSPPVLDIDRDGSSGYFIRFKGSPRSVYLLQRALGLTGPWTTIATQTAPCSGLMEFWDPSPPPGQAFYRTAQP